MKSRSRPATTCVIEPSAKYSVKTGPPRTDEIDLPFAGFVHVTVNARSTCHRSRTTCAALVEVLPGREDALGVHEDGEAADADRARPVDVRVRDDVRRGGKGRRGKRERCQDGGDEESQVVLLSRGGCHTSNPCDAMTEPKLGAGAAGPERLVRRPVGTQPAAVPAHPAPRPVDEDAPARPGVAAAEPGPAARGDLLEEAPRGERVGERPDRQAGAVVAELGAARPGERATAARSLRRGSCSARRPPSPRSRRPRLARGALGGCGATRRPPRRRRAPRR